MARMSFRGFRGISNKIPPQDMCSVKWVGDTAVVSPFLTECQNIDISNDAKLNIRSGATLKLSEPAHSLWSDNEICLYRSGSYLKRLNKDYTSTIIRSGLSPQPITMSYIKILDNIYYSDGFSGGVIDKHGNSRDWMSTYPHHNLDMRRKVVTVEKLPYGSILEYFNGRMYSVRDNVVYYSEPFLYELYDPSSNYIVFDRPVTMWMAIGGALPGVPGGIWAATDEKLYYLEGDAPPFKFRLKADYGVIKNTAKRVPSDVLSRVKDSDTCILWASPYGICAGFNGGSFKNLTIDTYHPPSAFEGASLFREKEGFKQFIISLKGG